MTSTESWLVVTSLLFVTLVSSTIIFGAALLLNRLVKKFSAAMRCRIWLLSLTACFLPAVLLTITSVVHHDAGRQLGTPVAEHGDASEVMDGSEFSSKSNSSKYSARDQAMIASDHFPASAEFAAEGQLQVPNTAPPESLAGDMASVNLNTQLVPMSLIDKSESSELDGQLMLSLDLCRVVVIGWITIALILIVRLTVNLVRSVYVWRLRIGESSIAVSQSSETVDPSFDSLAIRTSDAITVPLVAGIIRPVVILPASAINWPPSQVRLVLQHELAHIHRKDIAWNCLVSLLRAIIWFQPLAWIVQRRLRDDQEFACDDAVLLGGNDAPEYASILLRIAESVLYRRQCSVSSVAMANSSSVERRIRSILEPSRNRQESRRQRTTYSIGVALTLLLLVFVSFAWTPQLALANQDVDPASKPTTAKGLSADQAATDDKPPESPVDDKVHRFKHRVLDESGAAVAGAVVTIMSRNFRGEFTTTDADGWCEIAVPSGSDSTPNIFMMRAVSKDGDQIGIQKYELKDKRLLFTGPARLMPTCLQKVQVIDSQGNPIADAAVGIVGAEDIFSVSKTDASGVATVRRSPESGRVFALKDGAGFDFANLRSLDIKTGETEDITLSLTGARQITFRVVTPTEFSSTGSNTSSALFVNEIEEKKYIEKLEPLEGVCVLPESLHSSDGSFRTSLFRDSPLMAEFCPTSNAVGEATIRWMPKFTSIMWPFRFDGKGLCSNEHKIEADEVDEIHQVVVDRLVEIQGHVVDDNGKPVAGSVVRASGKYWDPQKPFSYNGSLISEADGRFSMFVPPRQDLLLLVEGSGQVSRTQVRAILPLKSPLNVELSFGGRNQISGLLTSGPDRTPLADRVIDFSHVSSGEEFSEFMDAKHRKWGLVISMQVRTDEHGRYSLQVGDGEWRLKNPFEKFEESSMTSKGSFQVQKDFHSDDKTLLRTIIISAKTQQEERGAVDISGVTQFLQNGQLPVVSRTPHLFEATSPSGKAFTVWDGQSNEFRILVAPIVTAHGQLVDENGTPLANRSIRYMILPSVPKDAKLTKKYDYGNSGSISTDEQGKFTLTNFIHGCECQVMATNDEDKEWAKKQWHVLKSVVPNSDDAIDLGQLALSQATPDVK